MVGSTNAYIADTASELRGGLELVDEPAGVGQGEVLGPGDAVLVAEQSLEVGVLPAPEDAVMKTHGLLKEIV